MSATRTRHRTIRGPFAQYEPERRQRGRGFSPQASDVYTTISLANLITHNMRARSNNNGPRATTVGRELLATFSPGAPVFTLAQLLGTAPLDPGVGCLARGRRSAGSVSLRPAATA